MPPLPLAPQQHAAAAEAAIAATTPRRDIAREPFGLTSAVIALVKMSASSPSAPSGRLVV